MERPNKTSYYLDIAKVVSSRSTCLRKHWGSIIVNNDVIISTGYNGAPRGCANCSDKGVCWRAEHNIPRGTRYELCAANGVHSEQNAIISAGREKCIGATMYVFGIDVESNGIVHNPDSCQMCKRAIINSGIKNVIYATESKEDGTYEFKESIVEHWVKNGAVEPNLEGY